MKTLPDFYRDLNRDMAKGERWTVFPDGSDYVWWQPWGIWQPIGYTPKKLQQLVTQSIDPAAVEQCKTRLCRGMTTCSASSDVYTVSLHFGRHTANKVISPLRYKMGECLSMIVFRVYKGELKTPLVVWRTTETIRRVVADFVLLDNLFRWLGISQHVSKVQFLFCSLWIANFNLQVLGRLDPSNGTWCKDSWRHLFFPKKIPPKYRARAIAWNVAKNIKHPMFNGHGYMKRMYLESDFPKVDMNGNVISTKS